MTTSQIVKLVVQICAGSGIVGLDAIAIIYMFLQGKSYLSKVPNMNDYLVFKTLERREEEIARDKEIWRTVGERTYAWLPWITLTSLILVALVLILLAYFGAGRVDMPQAN